MKFPAIAIVAALVLSACGGSDKTPPTGVDPPVVVPPVLTPGSAQTFDGALNSVLEVAPFVTVKDPSGNPRAAVWVKWAATAGKLENDSSLTDATGRATAGRWTIDTVAGRQTVTARAGTVSVVAMTAQIAPGPMVGLVPATPTITGVVGSIVATPVSAKAVDRYGNGVPGIFVQFAMWSGEGTLTGTQQTTNENGVATVGSWKLGNKSGPQSIRVDDHRTGATTLLLANASPAPASQFVVVEGGVQTGQANKRVCTSPVIAVRDQYGNGIGDISIVFVPAAGSGSVTGGSTLSAPGTGYATLGTWTLATAATQTVAVTSPSVPGVSATITATVGPAAAFSVCVRYLGGNITPRVRQAVSGAVERWQRVIVGHSQTTQVVEVANRCFDGAPALNESVEDLLVFVQVTALDGPGNSVARAGTCTVHNPSSLAQTGVLQLDSTDIALQLGQGTLDNMVAHELGHVLGFGTLWFARSLLSGAQSDDPFFVGASARAEFARLFGSYAGNAVPVENTGDQNTRNTHWRRSVFNNELMQGFSSASMPLSSVTVGSFGDLGYTVDLSKAEVFSFNGALRMSGGSTHEIVDEVLDAAVYGFDRNGRRTLVRAAGNPIAMSARPRDTNPD